MWPIQARALVDAGIAVVLVDSFTPRGVSEVWSDQLRISFGKRLQDVHHVLDALRADPRFMAQKIAIGGHSNGGVMALLSSYADLAPLLGRSSAGFNAFIATSAACNLTPKGTRLNGPLFLVNGTKDDYCWPEPCIDEVKRLVEAGQPARITLIDGAYHSLSTTGVTWNPRVMRPPREAPRVYYKTFGYDSSSASTVENAATGEVSTVRELMKAHGGFLGRLLFGAHVGGAMDKAAEAAAATTAFLKSHGW
jgi:dienelactone hydrolase